VMGISSASDSMELAVTTRMLEARPNANAAAGTKKAGTARSSIRSRAARITIPVAATRPAAAMAAGSHAGGATDPASPSIGGA
jgi:hypothetical protein